MTWPASIVEDLFLIGQLAIDQEVATSGKYSLGQLLDGVAAVAQDTLVAVE